ncbi:hypothetical protein FDB34_16480, partial [Clostridium botulinum]|nr:hypothetical protein [Clostridium botulinum]
MFKNLFALSEQGVKDLKKGIISSFLADLSLMIPVNIFILLIGEMIKPLFNEQKSNINIWFYTIISIIGFILIYVFNYYKYENTFNAAYVESANRRISLAEKIRKLPLSFLERKDLSELTTTMMGDCTELEHTFSHAIPQAGGSILSILLVSIYNSAFLIEKFSSQINKQILKLFLESVKFFQLAYRLRQHN